MFTCGFNKYSQLDKNSNNKNILGSPIIDKPVKYHADASSFSSFSTNYYQTVWISKDGKCYVTGNNSDCMISGSLPREVLGEDTELFLKDDRGQPCKFVSVYCSSCFTLYLVSDESGVSNFRLVYCYYKKTPNPLFLNIGNRIPRALFGGRKTAGVIDSEGGIIVITESVFNSPIQQIETTFLPHGDKAVKLACCDKFMISLGESGRVYKSEISERSSPKFSEMKEFSNKTVIDVTGTYEHCFVVLNDGRVFGIGNNDFCKLGLPEKIESVLSFTEIESLKKHKIVSAFAGTYNSVFKTLEGKMIVCGRNDNGQLFIPRKDKVYPPKEVKLFQGFSFCIAGDSVSAAFLGIDPPPNVANKKISEIFFVPKKLKLDERKIFTPTKSATSTSTSISTTSSELESLKKIVSSKEIEITDLKTTIKNKENEISRLKEEISNLKERNKNLDLENKKLKIDSQSKSKSKEEEEEKEEKKGGKSSEESENHGEEEENMFFGPEEESNFETVGIVGEGKTSTVYKIIDKCTNVPICKKVLKTEGSSYKDLQNAIKEFQVLHNLRHPSICHALALNTSENVKNNKTSEDEDDDKEEVTTVAILLEFIDYSLKECLEKNMINNTLKTRIIVEISQGLKYLHSKNMIYRDLKLSNIMLNSVFQAKLIDFGLVKINEYLLGEEVMNSISMTNSVFDAVFMSPELLKDEEFDNKTDVFSFGIVLYFLFVGNLPKQSIKDKMMDKQIDLPDASPSISECCIELIKKCIEQDPKERPSFEDILNILRTNKYMLASDVDPSIVSQRDQELERINNK